MKTKQRKWYDLDTNGDDADLLIYDVIGESWDGGISAKQFATDLKALGDVKNINLHINSPGGLVYEGTTIYNTLVAHPATVNVHIDGMAASIASIIAMAGDHITMADNALMMIHDPWSFVIGNAMDFRKEAAALDKVKSNLVTTYVNRTGIDESDISNMMAAETWLTGDEAVNMGFADEVREGKKIAAHYNRDDLVRLHFNHVPEIQNISDVPNDGMSVGLARAKVLLAETEFNMPLHD